MKFVGPRCTWRSPASLLVILTVLAVRDGLSGGFAGVDAQFNALELAPLTGSNELSGNGKAYIYRSSFPVYNVTGVLSFNPLGSGSSMDCNQNSRSQMIQWFLEECYPKGGNALPRATPNKRSPNGGRSFDLRPYFVGNDGHNGEEGRQGQDGQRIWKRSAQAIPSVHASQVAEAMFMMDKCCRTLDCTETLLRNYFDGLCHSNQIRSRAVLRA